jgi:MFS family permease
MLSPLKRHILPTNGRLPPQVIILGLVSLLNDAASEMIYPLLPIFLTATLGATPLMVGIIEGAADALASILKLFAGTWSDKLGRRKPLVASGYALAAASRALIGAATGWTAVLAARLIDRTGKGIRSAPRDALIADVTDVSQRGRAFGFHRALDHTGAIIGPLLAVLLLSGLHFEMRTMFFLAVIPGVIGVVLILFGIREKIAAADDAIPLDGAPLDRRFRRVMVAIALFALANSSDAFLILQAHAAGVSVAMLPLLWAAHHVVKSLFSTQAGALSDRVGRRKMLAAGWISYAIIYALFPLAQSLPAFIALFVAYAIPFTLTEGAERALISDLVPAVSRGKGFGIYYLVTGMGVLAGSTLFGLLYQNVSAPAAFMTGGALAVTAAVALAAPRHPEAA